MAKSLADKVDVASIVLPVRNSEIEKITPFLEQEGFPRPNLVYHFYKNRRGKYKDIKVWCTANLGICRVTPLFVTDLNYNVLPVEEYKITVKD